MGAFDDILTEWGRPARRTKEISPMSDKRKAAAREQAPTAEQLAEMSDDELWRSYASAATPGLPAGRGAIESLRTALGAGGRSDLLEDVVRAVTANGVNTLADASAPSAKELAEMSDDDLWRSITG